MANCLQNENSPYLLQHAENPVDWYPWGEDALQKAKSEDKPIFLSIGYAACHWCHVMAHESFEDVEIAAIMNRHFVNIKVDREERPDLDAIYMKAVVALTGQGGWPMSVFLTPEGLPFYGGTYFPPVRRFNMPSFREVLQGVANAWATDRENLLDSGEKLRDHLLAENRSSGKTGSNRSLDENTLDKSLMTLAQTYDWQTGGWGKAPKFPQPMTIEFLLRRAERGDSLALQMATHALDRMAQGGMYDVIGGGFSRYSVDDHWLVPHFEKMLYDNALLAKVYLYAYLITGNDFYRQICEETLDFVMREMTHPSGGFFSSLDADSEGEEGKFYLWTREDISESLGNQEEAEKVAEYFGVTDEGNFEGKNILRAPLEGRTRSSMRNLHLIKASMLGFRNKRIRPDPDDKVIVNWNGLMCLAFSEAARYLGRADYKEMAVKNARFLLDALLVNGRLSRTWRNGKIGSPGTLEDYASLILALVSVYETDEDVSWYGAVGTLADRMLSLFHDAETGLFYDTPHDCSTPLFRPRKLQDNAVPSGNSLAALALLKLAAFGGNGEWVNIVSRGLAFVSGWVERFPTGFSNWLCAIDWWAGPILEVAILGPPSDPLRNEMRTALWKKYRPRLVAAFSDYPPLPNSPALLEHRAPAGNRTTAFVCQGFVCQQPVTTVKGLQDQL